MVALVWPRRANHGEQFVNKSYPIVLIASRAGDGGFQGAVTAKDGFGEKKDEYLNHAAECREMAHSFT